MRTLYGAPSTRVPDPGGGATLLYRPRPRAAPELRYAFTVAKLGRAPGRYVSAMSVGLTPEVLSSEGCS